MKIEATNVAWGIWTLQMQYNLNLYERLAMSREKVTGGKFRSYLNSI